MPFGEHPSRQKIGYAAAAMIFTKYDRLYWFYFVYNHIGKKFQFPEFQTL